MTSLQIEYFLQLCAIRNMTATAEFLHISQPVISRQIAALEKELGMALFTRTHSGMALTAAGQIMYDFFSKFKENLQKAVLDAKICNAKAIQQIRIGVLEHSIIPPIRLLLKQQQTIHRDVSISLERRSVPISGNALLAGDLDIAFTFSDMIPNVPDISCQPLFPTHDCILASSQEKTITPGNLSLDDCANQTIYLARPCSLKTLPQSHPGARLIGHPGLRSAEFVFLANNSSVLEQVRSGLGYGAQNSSILINIAADYLVLYLTRSSDAVIAWRSDDRRPVIKETVDGFLQIDWNRYLLGPDKQSSQA